MKKRVTLSIDHDLDVAYREHAHDLRTNLSAFINDWLRSSLPAVDSMVSTIQNAKQSPSRAIADLSIFTEKMNEELLGLQGALRVLQGGSDEQPTAAQARTHAKKNSTQAVSSPPSNTGLKPPSF